MLSYLERLRPTAHEVPVVEPLKIETLNLPPQFPKGASVNIAQRFCWLTVVSPEDVK